MKPKNSPIPNDDTGEIVELTIDSLSYNGGRGVGRYEGIVVFVPGTAPEDRVRVRVINKKPRFWEAELASVIKPSPWRRTPPCPVANRCGGCSWQHVDYPTQLEQKAQILKSNLRPLLKFGEVKVLPLIAAPSEWHYRSRIQLQVVNGRIGFFAKRSNDLVEIEQCLISDPQINQELKTGDFRTMSRVQIAVDEGLVRLSSGAQTPKEGLFSQVHEAQNKVLKARVVDLSQPGAAWIMDLFAGSGNLTLPLAQHFNSVAITAIEVSQASVNKAKSLKHDRITWHVGDVAQVLARLTPPPGPGLIVLDPPRTGLTPDVIAQLIRYKPKQILYVSCNPTTWARDSERLLKGGMYRLLTVQGLDMFPQTEHLELISSFHLSHDLN